MSNTSFQASGTLSQVSRNAYTVTTVTVDNGSAAELESILSAKFDLNAKAYFKIPVIVDVSHLRYIDNLDYKGMVQVCQNHNVCLLGVSGVDDVMCIDYLHSKNIPLINSNKYIKVKQEMEKPKVITQTFEVKVPVEVQIPVEVKVPYEVKCNIPPVVITRPVRSGESVGAPGNSIVIFGSVGAGAKIIAEHNIFIIGDVKGANLYAGNPKSNDDPGFTDAIIYVSGHFDPGFIAIAGNYQTAEDMDRDPLIGPGIGKNESIVVSLDRQSLHYWSAKEFMQNKNV